MRWVGDGTAITEEECDQWLEVTARNFPIVTSNHLVQWELAKRGFGTALSGDVHVLHERAETRDHGHEEDARHFHDKWGRLRAEAEGVAIGREELDAWSPEPLP